MYNHDLELLPYYVGSQHPAMIVDVFAWGYEHDTYIRRIRDRWTGEALYELHDELVTAPVTTSQSKTSFMLIFADMTWLNDEILAELENPADRQAHVEYILDARDVGIQQIGLHVVSDTVMLREDFSFSSLLAELRTPPSA